MNIRELLTPLLGLTCAVTLAATFSAPAHASKEKARYTSDNCKSATARCGAIIYGNGGGYTVQPVKLNADSKQPSGVTVNANCVGVDAELDYGVNLDQYVVFIVPANCAYRLKIKIVTGPSKDRHLFLTPGCQIRATTKGTTQQNKWKNIDVRWIKGKKPTDAPSNPQDADGHKCGSLGNM